MVSKTLRKEDVFARYGGEEFAVLMQNIDDAGALILAQRIRRDIRRHPFTIDKKQIHVTVSFGIGSLAEGMSEPDELVRLADKYLYHAKKAGRDRIGGRALKAVPQSNSASATIIEDPAARRQRR